ncbi:Sphingolipid C4-hydroxylase sur2 [Saxophila tyrrhenica]|uniref:Sphingolipid C4-hydroxylase sur2 n=1 Tax=Saxophila tyrrhenica TaxID=1690608 RepID=A0AAV9NXS4_9PEZI|nr:Sphingolipid C4-hydroxylase sur2 [Saxophila tyrrhenica]
MFDNTTAPVNAYDIPTPPPYTLKPQPSLIPGIADQHLVLALPIIAYWAFSLLFHLIDEYDLFPQHRLHTPAEVLKRNHASRWDVFRDVIIQQLVQTAFGLGLAYFEGVPTYGSEEHDVAVWAGRIRLAQRGIPALLATLGVDSAGLVEKLGSDNSILAGMLSGGFYPTELLSGQSTAPAFAQWELTAANAVYHIIVPACQFLLAICIVDTYQYFVHRGMHMNKWLYTTLHSRHHRLYVPYAYGALYNHPLEGLFLDTVGTGLAYLISGLTVRQSMWLFTCATIKTVDDHCGYAFPWDPLQHLTSNNAGYHDVHHQSWGIKTNFSQPFFTFWDQLLGTKWTGGDVSARYERAKIAAQKKVDADAKAVTASRPRDSVSAVNAEPYDVNNTSSAARTAQSVTEPRIPAGKAAIQALSSRQQILDDTQSGGIGVLAEESTEEVRERQKPTFRSPRKRTASSGLKGFADRVGESLQGRNTGVLGVERTKKRSARLSRESQKPCGSCTLSNPLERSLSAISSHLRWAETWVKMKFAILAALTLSASAAASYVRNLNYNSPSINHPGLGISLHKVNKRNTLGKRFDASSLNFTHSVASGDPYSDSVILWQVWQSVQEGSR